MLRYEPTIPDLGLAYGRATVAMSVAFGKKILALIFERIHTGGIAEFFHLVSDDSEGVAAVFDPRSDVEC